MVWNQNSALIPRLLGRRPLLLSTIWNVFMSVNGPNITIEMDHKPLFNIAQKYVNMPPRLVCITILHIQAAISTKFDLLSSHLDIEPYG